VEKIKRQEMKKAINIWSFEQGRPYIEYMQIAKDAGFDGIEIGILEEGELNLDSPEREILRFRELADRIGIEIKSVVSGMYWKYPITHGDQRVREHAKQSVRKHLRGASLLGADTILVVPGGVGTDYIPDFPVVDYEVAYNRALEAFRELAPEAEQYKVNIGIENVWNKFLLSPLEFRSFIDSIGSPFVGCYFDVANTLLTGYPDQWIRILGRERIRKVHVKDFRTSVGTLNGFVDLLAGDVDFKAVLAALKEIGYNDYLTAEMIPTYQQYSDQMIYNTAASLDRIIKGI
jgi:hexulose-6-phosphate isomerase